MFYSRSFLSYFKQKRCGENSINKHTTSKFLKFSFKTYVVQNGNVQVTNIEITSKNMC